MAIAGFKEDLIPILLKLASPNSTKNLRELAVTSERCDRHIRWIQNAKLVKSYSRNVKCIQRRVRVYEGSHAGTGKQRQTTVNEIEFQKTFVIPNRFRSHVFPSYFRVPGGSRIRIGLSLRMKGQKANVDQSGLFFYPIGVANGFTGNAVNINAPFEMTNDRSQIKDQNNSSWNRWLLETASKFTMEMLTSDWIHRFGPSAYEAVRPGENSTPAGDVFANSLRIHLSEQQCWPTRMRNSGRRKGVALAKADSLVIPISDSLDGFLSEKRYLEPSFAANEAIREMAREYGAKEFSVGSLVRLRCAGKSAADLVTELTKQEASFYYSDFPDRLLSIDVQTRFAEAFDASRRRLTKNNKEDLRRSKTTLNAAGSLESPDEPLWVVDPAVSSVALVSETSQLHPRLHGFKSVATLCREFDVADWSRNVARKAVEGNAGEDELEALLWACNRNAWSAGQAYQGVVAKISHNQRPQRTLDRTFFDNQPQRSRSETFGAGPTFAA